MATSDSHANAAASLIDLLNLMARLRDPETGCPWDLAQTPITIAPYTIEEAYEVADAVERGDPHAIKDELGDLLFQTVFQAQLAQEAGLFDFGDIARAIHDKMIRRHPHVFKPQAVDTPIVSTASDQTLAWDQHKAKERAGKPVLDGVPLNLPALTRAEKLQKRAARVGFDWGSARPILAKVAEEAQELVDALDQGASKAKLTDELGDILFVVVNLARHLDIDPETALRGTNAKFERRFGFIENQLAALGRKPQDASLDEMEELWRQAKLTEKAK
jgi:ATP diphosphatase